MQIILNVLLLYLRRSTYKKERVIGLPSYLPFSQKHMYVLYMTMITFKTLSFNNYSQDFYNEDIKSLDLNKVKCTCGSTSHFHRHACYQRYLTIDANHILIDKSK